MTNNYYTNNSQGSYANYNNSYTNNPQGSYANQINANHSLDLNVFDNPRSLHLLHQEAHRSGGYVSARTIAHVEENFQISLIKQIYFINN